MNVLRKVASRDAATIVRWQRGKTLLNRSIPGLDLNARYPPSETAIPSAYLYNPHQSTARRCFSTETTSTTASPPDHASIIVDTNHRIQACALQGDAVQAQHHLDELESLLMTNANTPEQKAAAQESLLEGREAVLDAWISRQTTLYLEWQSADRDKQRQLKPLIIQAAKQAHKALEQTVPFLTRPAVAIYTPQRKQLSEYDQAVLENPDGVLGNPSAKHRNTQVMMHRCNGVLTAWARASRVATGRHGIPQRATFLIQRMEASLKGSSAAPTTDAYNRVLEAWAWSKEHLRATMAEQLFVSMLQKGRKQESLPDGNSYKWIVHAWCKSDEKAAAFNATGHLMKWLRRLEKGQEYIEPTAATYHLVMDAWVRAEDRNAPIKALSILRIMEYAHDNKFSSVQVDKTCNKYYLMASANRSLLPEQGPLADQILIKLKNQQIVPDQDCYRASIQIWKNSAVNPRFADKREDSIARTVELLQELSLAHHRSALVSVKPTTENYNDVLEALSASKIVVSKSIAETLVKVMEDSMAKDEASEIRPNADTYKWLLSVHAKSKSADKLAAAKQVMERVKAGQDKKEPASNESLLGVYNAFIGVCESVKAEDATNVEFLQEALRSVEEMKSSYGLTPNSQTYATLLDACNKHLVVGVDRSRIVESIFESCCSEGLVDESVLKSVKAATSEEQYFDLVFSKSEGMEGTRIVPESWTRNVEVRHVTKAAPLTVDGKFRVTVAMKEERMRKLRSKVNQRTLQGGRLKLHKKKRGEAIRIQLDEEALKKYSQK